MDEKAVTALLSAILLLGVSAGVFMITGMRPLPAMPNIPMGMTWSGMALSGVTTAGGYAPYLIWLGGPLADLYYQEFRYTLMTLISIGSMLAGFAFQIVFGGGRGILPAITVGTAAASVYIIQDAWLTPMSLEKQIIATSVGSLISILTALVANAAPGSSPLRDAMSALLLGAGLGELAWVVVYNVNKDLLPFAKRS
jgi:hypothetical protein